MTAKIKLNAASGGGSISIQAPSSSGNNRVITLPDIADGTLVTSQSTLDATKLSGNLPALNGSALTGISGGKLLTSGVADSWSGSTASSSYVDSYSFNITPSATSSKVLILAAMNHVQDSTTNWSTKVLRDSTSVFERSQWKFSSTNRMI